MVGEEHIGLQVPSDVHPAVPVKWSIGDRNQLVFGNPDREKLLLSELARNRDRRTGFYQMVAPAHHRKGGTFMDIRKVHTSLLRGSELIRLGERVTYLRSGLG